MPTRITTRIEQRGGKSVRELIRDAETFVGATVEATVNAALRLYRGGRVIDVDGSGVRPVRTARRQVIVAVPTVDLVTANYAADVRTMVRQVLQGVAGYAYDTGRLSREIEIWFRPYGQAARRVAGTGGVRKFEPGDRLDIWLVARRVNPGGRDRRPYGYAVNRRFRRGAVARSILRGTSGRQSAGFIRLVARRLRRSPVLYVRGATRGQAWSRQVGFQISVRRAIVRAAGRI